MHYVCPVQVRDHEHHVAGVESGQREVEQAYLLQQVGKGHARDVLHDQVDLVAVGEEVS